MIAVAVAAIVIPVVRVTMTAIQVANHRRRRPRRQILAPPRLRPANLVARKLAMMTIIPDPGVVRKVALRL